MTSSGMQRGESGTAFSASARRHTCLERMPLWNWASTSASKGKSSPVRRVLAAQSGLAIERGHAELRRPPFVRYIVGCGKPVGECERQLGREMPPKASQGVPLTRGSRSSPPYNPSCILQQIGLPHFLPLLEYSTF